MEPMIIEPSRSGWWAIINDRQVGPYKSRNAAENAWYELDRFYKYHTAGLPPMAKPIGD